MATGAVPHDGWVTIHRGDPFLAPEPERSAARRLRARLAAPVTLWTAGDAHARAGLTVASALVVDGAPGRLLGLVDPESELWEVASSTGRLTMSPLASKQRHLADVFGGTAPAPGGPFRLASWRDTAWGPVLADATSWCGGRIEAAREVGYSLLVDVEIEHVEVGDDAAALLFYRGRYGEPA